MGSLAIPNPYVVGGNSYSISDGEQLLEDDRKKAKHTLSLTEQLQFARQITLGMVSCGDLCWGFPLLLYVPRA